MSSLIDHFEQTLGPIQFGWSADQAGRDMPFQVTRHGSLPFDESCSAYVTIGLSSSPLISRVSGKAVRCEFLFMGRACDEERAVPGLLQQVGMEVLSSTSALLRGDCIGPRGPLIAGTKLEALYAAIPVYLPDSFSTYYHAELGSIVVIWLVPITRAEANYVAEFGWDSFEGLLEERSPDLLDYRRLSMC